MQTAEQIAAKWVKRLGLGFHPDTPGADYSPAMSADDVSEYNADIERLFGLTDDPYLVVLNVMQADGLGVLSYDA